MATVPTQPLLQPVFIPGSGETQKALSLDPSDAGIRSEHVYKKVHISVWEMGVGTILILRCGIYEPSQYADGAVSQRHRCQ